MLQVALSQPSSVFVWVAVREGKREVQRKTPRLFSFSLNLEIFTKSTRFGCFTVKYSELECHFWNKC